MKLGVVFPQTEIGNDPIAIRDYAQAAEQLGYNHILVFDHVLGAHPDRFQELGFRPPYNYQTPFHEPFVLFGFLAGVTTRIELVTGILILPQRQTALVAKQAAEVDVLTGGRLRLGVGIGWNPVEYEALGENFRNRGRRVEEQIALLRELWTQELVDFEGKYHQRAPGRHQPAAGAAPDPDLDGRHVGARAQARRPDRRRLVPAVPARPASPPRPSSAFAHTSATPAATSTTLASRDGSASSTRPKTEWAAALDGWKELGASHVTFNTMNVGLESPQAHIDAIRRFSEVAASYR